MKRPPRRRAPTGGDTEVGYRGVDVVDGESRARRVLVEDVAEDAELDGLEGDVERGGGPA